MGSGLAVVPHRQTGTMADEVVLEKVDLDAVRAAAARLRRACEQEKPHLLDVQFRLFPRGACGSTAVLLGEYLQRCGLGTWTYVSGWAAAPRGTHAWIERDGVIVDITADQFDEKIHEPVIVTTDPSWHAQFADRMGSHPATLEHEATISNQASVLASDFERLLRHLGD